MKRAGSRGQADRYAQSLPPGQRARRDFPRFGTHLYLPPPAIPAAPVIEIAGAVRSRFSVPMTDLAELPRIEVTSGLHCVSGWSATGLRWEGVSFADFYRRFIEPALSDEKPGWLVLEGFDGYRVVECLDDALADDVLLADRLNGAPITADHGGPIRFVSPEQYGYVSAKHLARIEVSVEEPRENYGYVHPLGWLIMRPPLFWRHPRARVWREERNRHLPPSVLRLVYPALRPPIRWLSRREPLPHVDPEPPRGAVSRTMIRLLGTRPVLWFEGTPIWRIPWWRLVPRLWLLTGGRLGGNAPIPAGLLETTDTRNGRPHRRVLFYFHDDDKVILIATKGGLAEDPFWYENALAAPEVRFAGEPFRAEPVDAEAELDRLWGLADRYFPPFAAYRALTARHHRAIPILRLIPRSMSTVEVRESARPAAPCG